MQHLSHGHLFLASISVHLPYAFKSFKQLIRHFTSYDKTLTLYSIHPQLTKSCSNSAYHAICIKNSLLLTRLSFKSICKDDHSCRLPHSVSHISNAHSRIDISVSAVGSRSSNQKPHKSLQTQLQLYQPVEKKVIQMEMLNRTPFQLLVKSTGYSNTQVHLQMLIPKVLKMIVDHLMTLLVCILLLYLYSII